VVPLRSTTPVTFHVRWKLIMKQKKFFLFAALLLVINGCNFEDVATKLRYILEEKANCLLQSKDTFLTFDYLPNTNGSYCLILLPNKKIPKSELVQLKIPTRIAENIFKQMGYLKERFDGDAIIGDWIIVWREKTNTPCWTGCSIQPSEVLFVMKNSEKTIVTLEKSGTTVKISSLK